MPTAVQEDIFTPETLDWFRRLSEGGGDLPPISDSSNPDGGNESKSYVDVVALSTAFYKVVKITVEEGLLDWEKAWGYTGCNNFEGIRKRLRQECMTPSQRSEVHKPHINYKYFTKRVIRELVERETCFYRSQQNEKPASMVVDAHQIADDAIDVLEGFFQRGAKGAVRRMWLENEINTGISPAAFCSEEAVKARGYQEIVDGYERASFKRVELFREVFRKHVNPEIIKIGSPMFSVNGIQLADKPRLDLTP